MATELLIKPPFEVLSEYPVPLSAKEVYTKLNNHHGDQFGDADELPPYIQRQLT